VSGLQNPIFQRNIVAVSEISGPHDGPLEYRAGQQFFFQLEKDVSLETQ
jgi:hypothetical protein